METRKAPLFSQDVNIYPFMMVLVYHKESNLKLFHTKRELECGIIEMVLQWTVSLQDGHNQIS